MNHNNSNKETTINGWSEYQKLVLSELERLSDWLESAEKRINELRLEVAILKVKSGIWGLMGGLIPVLIYLVIEVVLKLR